MNDAEALERGLVLAGLDALRQREGDAVVRLILSRASAPGGDPGAVDQPLRVVDYLRYRDAALEHLGERFFSVAFETGRVLVRNLRHPSLDEVRRFLTGSDSQSGRLALLGQAAVLAARGHPGVVSARLAEPCRLLITIAECPECRELRRAEPFCYLNQGMLTEFAARYLQTAVRTSEVDCIAQGAPSCRIEVSLVH